MKDRIFVSYRLADSAAVAGRIADQLKHHFGEHLVFFDKSDLRVAETWYPAIDAALAKSAIIIVVIGPDWLTAKGADGQRRLDQAGDVVRHEIETGLANGARVIPLTVDGATFPKPEDLPEAIRGLTAVNGDIVRRDQLTLAAFEDDIGRLMRNVSAIIQSVHPPAPPARLALQSAERSSRIADMARTVLTSPTVPPRITRRLAPDRFLRQDPAQDVADYSSERPVAPYLPYVEVKNWCREFVEQRPPRIEVRVLKGEFELESWGNGDGDAIRNAALAAILAAKPMTHNGKAVRLECATATDQALFLTAQRTRYFAQLQSNLALDYQYKRPGGSVITLRDLLRQKYGTQLPDLADGRLANTLGVAALILCKDEEGLTPYLVSRSKDVAVFNCGGEWHCTASGVAEMDTTWPHREAQFYIDSMLKELDEEVGLLRHELDSFAPVAFCREMTRAGKPQMFFLGITSLPMDELMRKQKAARKRTKAQGQIVENTAAPFLRRKADLGSGEGLAMFHDKGFTIEAAACLHYFFQCQKIA